MRDSRRFLLFLAACATAAPSEDERRLATVQAALPFTLLVPTLPAGYRLKRAELGPPAPPSATRGYEALAQIVESLLE